MKLKCCVCEQPIEDNNGTYWIKGTGGIFARGVYTDEIFYAHWGNCAYVAGKYFAQFPPDENGESWFWDHLPFEIQSHENATSSDKFIYILKSGDYYKIGITTNIVRRKRELQTGNPIQLLFVCSSFFENAAEFENILHQAFDEYRVKGEWFNFPPEKLEEVIIFLENGNFKENILLLDNIVYYAPGTRVLWRNQPGFILGLRIKKYKYPIGYNIVLDTQVCRDKPKIKNAAYGELLLEETKLKSTEGYEVKPIEVDINKEPEIYTLAQLLKLRELT